MTDTNATTWDITDALVDIVSLAWTTFVGSQLVRLDTTHPGSDVVCASIAIAGPRNATVLFFADHALAQASTTYVLGVEPGEAVDADIHDVMGELVNIIGGNLKGLVSEYDAEWSLSLPMVSNAMQSAHGGKLVTHVCFSTDGGTLGCHILEHS
jgi:CheY-specific phosphatase CheX